MSVQPIDINCDLACCRCRYNLRGLRSDGRCPECGAGLAQSIVLRASFDLDFRRTYLQSIMEPIGYSADAAMFVLDAVRQAARLTGAWKRDASHLSAREVCNSIRIFARSYFNDDSESIDLLAAWGIRCSEDVGRIVFLLVQAGFLVARATDRLEDFNGVFTLDTLFRS